MPLYPPNTGGGTAGGAASTNTTQVGGVNGGNLITFNVDAAGNLYVDLRDGSGNLIASTGGSLNVNITGSSTLTVNQGTSPWVISGAVTQSGTWIVRNQDGSGNNLTSQVNGGQRALDIGIDVAGVQIDPRQIRALTNSDVVKAQLQDNSGTGVTSTAVNGRQALDIHQADTVFVVAGGVTAGSSPQTNPVLIAGIDGGGLTRSLKTDSSGRLEIDTAQSLPLPTGASTDASLTNGNLRGTVFAKLQDNAGTAITLGQKVMTSSVPVVIASDQSAIPATQSGIWVTRTQDGSGNAITSTGAALDINLKTSSITLNVKDTSDGPVTPGAVATNSMLMGGQFNTALPTLTNTQQSALQLDSNGRIIIRPLTSADVVSAVQSGNWSVRLQDGSGNVITSTSSALDENVKSWMGSVAPTVGQKTMANSLPVAIASDQTSLKTPLDILTSGTITALNGTVVSTLNGTGSLVFTLTGVWVATVVAEGSDDNTNWTNLTIFPSSGASTTAGVSANGTYRVPSVGAYTNIRLRASAFTSGTVTVTMNASQAVAAPQLFSPTAVNAKIDALSSKEAQSAAGNTFGMVASAFTITPANADNVAVYIKNPSASGKTLVLQQIEITSNTTSGGTSAAIVLWKLFANPTSSANGTVATINTTSVGSGAVSAMTVFTTPTVSANGTLLYASTATAGVPTEQKDMSIFRLAANNNLLITLDSGVNNAIVNVTVLWSEE
jgi:hypothetical protein